MISIAEDASVSLAEATQPVECQVNSSSQPAPMAYLKGAVATPLVALSKNPEHTQQLKLLLNKRQSSIEQNSYDNSSTNQPVNAVNSGLPDSSANNKCDNFKVDKGSSLLQYVYL